MDFHLKGTLKLVSDAFEDTIWLNWCLSNHNDIFQQQLIHFQQLFHGREVTRKCSVKIVFLKMLQNFEKHLCWGLFSDKVAGHQPATLLKREKRLQHSSFRVSFAKYLKTATLQNIRVQLLLQNANLILSILNKIEKNKTLLHFGKVQAKYS